MLQVPSMTRFPLGFLLLGWHLSRWLLWTVVFRFIPANAVFDRATRAAWCYGWTMQDVTPEEGQGYLAPSPRPDPSSCRCGGSNGAGSPRASSWSCWIRVPKASGTEAKGSLTVGESPISVPTEHQL